MTQERSPNKYKWCKMILVFTMVILTVRLWDLQVMQGSELRKQSEKNRVRITKVLAPRGIIFDRNGIILADSRPSFNLYIIREDMKYFNETIDGVARLLDVDRDEIMEKLQAHSALPSSFPVKIKSDISMDEVAKVEANKIYLLGVSVQIEPRRIYPHGKMLAHTLGYVSEISETELKRKEYKDYRQGDYIGKYGLERMYEAYLRGIDGEQRVEVDATGREIRTLDRKEPVAGNNLYLNIDMEAQTTAEKALENKKGAVVAIEPKTGGVIVFVSRPAFDPNHFSTGISKANWKMYNTDKAKPLLNRGIQGGFPPGSTFKVLVAIKALEDGIVNERTTFNCPGGFKFGNNYFRCWKKGGHGVVNMHRAIAESCDVYFYNVGLKIGVDGIRDMADAMGIGKITGIDLPNEINGIIPSQEWVRKRFNRRWYEGETVSVAIGQGAVWLTPVQLTQLTTFIANQGITFKPQIVNRVVSPEGKVIKRFEPVMVKNIRLKKDTVRLVRDGMKGVVNEPKGTAYGSRLPNVIMSGKTGTAESSKLDKSRNLGDHAWFIAYAPEDDPSIAMTVLVEHGGGGSAVAAPVAKTITEAYMKELTSIREAHAHGNR